MTPVFEHAARTILLPLIKIMLRNGVDMGTFSSIVKQVYVEVAQDPAFALETESGKPKKITASRIALLTGINRKEVKRLQDESYRPPDRSHTNRAVRVISGWTTDARYADKKGKPQVLPYTTKKTGVSFESLVRDYSGDMTPRVILDELVKVGAATTDEDARVTLTNQAYVPSADDEELMRIGSNAIRDLTETIAKNLEPDETERSLLQLSVNYNHVTEDGKKLYKSVLKKEATEFMTQQNRILSAVDKENNPAVDGPGTHRVGVGIYYFESASETPSEE